MLKYKLHVFFDNSNKSVCFYTLAIEMGFKTIFLGGAIKISELRKHNHIN